MDLSRALFLGKRGTLTKKMKGKSIGIIAYSHFHGDVLELHPTMSPWEKALNVRIQVDMTVGDGFTF